MINVAIAEDSRSYMKVLKDVLDTLDQVSLVMTATNGKDIFHNIVKAEVKPDLILMDIEMPLRDGIAATTKIKEIFPHIRIVMISVFDDRERVFQAIMAGASGYLLKGEQPGTIKRAIHDAMEDRLPMSPLIAGLTLEMVRGKTGNDIVGAEKLTPREMEVLHLLTDAKSYKEIGEQLSISIKTVGNHVQNIYAKLQVSSKAEAIKMAYAKKWV